MGVTELTSERPDAALIASKAFSIGTPSFARVNSPSYATCMPGTNRTRR